MKKHLIIASYDGISTYYCGIGTTMQDTITALNKLAETEDIKVSLAYIATDPHGDVFNKERFENSFNLVKNTGGQLIPLCNGTSGYSEFDMWRSFPQWEYLCASLATALNLIMDDQDENILMLHDTPYLLFHKFKQQIFNKNLRCFYMPRSAGLNHKFGDEQWRQKRVELEKEAFQAIKGDSNSSVLAIGKNFGQHLTNDYGVTFTPKDYLINGLCFNRYSAFLDKRFTLEDLRRFGIDLNPEAKIIFSWGRASIAKGLKEMLDAWREVSQQLPNHWMVLQAPNNSGENDYFQLLKKYEKEIPRTIVLDDFNPEIWQTILRTEGTDIVCIPSTMDPIPHTAIEAKLFSLDMNYVVVGSDADGVKDVFSDEECVWVNPYDKIEFAKGILQAASIDGPQRQHINKLNQESLNDFNYVETIRKFLQTNKFI